MPVSSPPRTLEQGTRRSNGGRGDLKTVSKLPAILSRTQNIEMNPVRCGLASRYSSPCPLLPAGRGAGTGPLG